MYDEANGVYPDWENISKINLQRFVEHMGERLSPNSVRQYAAKFKAVINMYSEEVDLPKGYERILSPKMEKSVSVWLTERELIKLSQYSPKTKIEKLVLAQFLIGAYTGARHSDYINFDKTNIVGDMLMYVSQKTKIQATVPLKPIVKILIAKRPVLNISDVTFNDTLRKICMLSGIKSVVKVFKAGKQITCQKFECVSSHTARRSFATNLYLRGADLYSISRMMGHSSVTMTEGYLCCGLRDQSEKVLGYFK